MNEQPRMSEEEVAPRLLPLLEAQLKLESMSNEELVKLLYNHLQPTTPGIMSWVLQQAMDRLAPNWLPMRAKTWDEELERLTRSGGEQTSEQLIMRDIDAIARRGTR